MMEEIPFKRLSDAYRDAVPFYQKNGFKFMGREEQNRYKSGREKTIAMYFDLLTI